MRPKGTADFAHVRGYQRLAIEVIRDALDEIGPPPAGRLPCRGPLRLAVRLPDARRGALRWLVEWPDEVAAWCTLTRLMSVPMVYQEARERLASFGLFDPRLDALATRAADDLAA